MSISEVAKPRGTSFCGLRLDRLTPCSRRPGRSLASKTLGCNRPMPRVQEDLAPTARGKCGSVGKTLVISTLFALADLAGVSAHADTIVNCSVLPDPRKEAQCRLMQGYLHDESDHRKPFPGCLAVRTVDQECQRKSLDDAWTCAKRPTISLSFQQSLMLPRCLVWDGAAESYCEAEYGRGAYAKGFCAIERQTPTSHKVTSIACLRPDAARRDDTPPRLPADIENAVHFVLQKNAFQPPECLAMRLRGHECLRSTVFDNWTCDARPPLDEFAGECFLSLAHKLPVSSPQATTNSILVSDDWVGGGVVGPLPCRPSP